MVERERKGERERKRERERERERERGGGGGGEGGRARREGVKEAKKEKQGNKRITLKTSTPTHAYTTILKSING